MATEKHVSHVKLYITIYLMLLALVVVTIGAAFVDMGDFSFIVAMSIAAFKTFLIVAVFMHVKDELPLVRIYAVLGLFWLPIFFSFVFADYLTRPRTYAGVVNTVTAAEMHNLNADSQSHHEGAESGATKGDAH